MKTADFRQLNGEAKIIGSIASVIKNGNEPEPQQLCIVSEKNLVSILKTMGNVSAKELAQKIASRLTFQSPKDDFNVVVLQDILTEEIDNIQFAVDCGELLIGDDSKIKEFLKS